MIQSHGQTILVHALYRNISGCKMLRTFRPTLLGCGLSWLIKILYKTKPPVNYVRILEFFQVKSSFVIIEPENKLTFEELTPAYSSSLARAHL